MAGFLAFVATRRLTRSPQRSQGNENCANWHRIVSGNETRRFKAKECYTQIRGAEAGSSISAVALPCTFSVVGGWSRARSSCSYQVVATWYRAGPADMASNEKEVKGKVITSAHSGNAPCRTKRTARRNTLTRETHFLFVHNGYCLGAVPSRQTC